MRKLKTTDIPACCRCLKKLGLEEKLRALAKKSNTMAEAWDNGFDLFWDIFDRATETDGEAAIYAFLAGPFEMTAQEVADLEIPELMAKMKQLAVENDLVGFFRSAGTWMR